MRQQAVDRANTVMGMTKNTIYWVLTTVLLTSTTVGIAQQPKKVQRVGYLSADDAASESIRAEPIRLALRELGYIEGQNIAIAYRYAEGSAIALLSLPRNLSVSRLKS